MEVTNNLLKELEDEVCMRLKGEHHTINKITKLTEQIDPEELLNLNDNNFMIVLMLCKHIITKLPQNVKKKFFKRALDASITPVEHGVKEYINDIFIALSGDEGASDESAHKIIKIIKKLSEANWTEADAKYLEIANKCSDEEFNDIVSRIEWRFSSFYSYDFSGWSPDRIEMVAKRKLSCRDYLNAKILRKLRIKFIEENAEEILKRTSEWELENLFLFPEEGDNTKEILNTRFIILAAKKAPRIIRFLPAEKLQEVYKNVSYLKKGIWARALENPNVAQYPDIFERSFKAFCVLKKNELNVSNIRIPDSIIQKLTVEEVKGLIIKTKDGKIEGIDFNVELLEPKVLVLAIKEPQYERELKPKYLAMLERQRHGESTYTTVKNFLLPGEWTQDEYKKAVRKVFSLSSFLEEEKIKAIEALIDLAMGASQEEIEIRYRKLAEKIRESLA